MTAMTIQDRGQWAAYTPATLPPGAPPNAMFCQRAADNVDWYAYLAAGTELAAGTVKATAYLVGGAWVVQAVTRDATQLFPAGARLIEITGIDPALTEAQLLANYGAGKMQFDPVALALAPPPVNLAAYAALARYGKETGGITVAGVPIATDRESQAMITGAYVVASTNAAWSTAWKTGTGAFVTVTAAQMIAIALAVAAHVGNCFASEATTDAAITAGTITTTAQVDAAFAAISTAY